jgi:ferritin-like metal-binding protein YciE
MGVSGVCSFRSKVDCTYQCLDFFLDAFLAHLGVKCGHRCRAAGSLFLYPVGGIGDKKLGGDMAGHGLRELYIDQLKDLYSAENQLVKALPKMAKAASSEELREGIEEHLEQTKGHVRRLVEIFDALDESPKGKTCAGMEGLIKEGKETIDEDFEGPVMDAALIGAAQRVEHYEIAAYGTAREFAQVLGESEHVELLSQTLEEEKETDEKLTALAREINPQANEVEAESDHEGSGARRKRAA